MKRLTRKYGIGMKYYNMAPGESTIDRLAEIEDILGDDYDLSRLRELVEKVWSPCNFCAGAKYITGGVTAVCPVSETRQQETLAEGDFDFCPVCGRPLTDEAVQMVMKRWKEAVSNEA